MYPVALIASYYCGSQRELQQHNDGGTAFNSHMMSEQNVHHVEDNIAKCIFKENFLYNMIWF